MASRDEIVDADRGLRAVRRPRDAPARTVAHTFEEHGYAEGERVLRQGLSGSAFHVILDGEAAVVIDGEQRATLGRGDFFGEVSILLGEPPVADVVATPPAPLPRPRRSRGPAVPARQPAGDVPDAPGAGAPPAERQPVAELRPTARSRRATTRSSSSGAGRAGCRSRTASAGSGSSTPCSRPTTRPAACSGAGRSSSGSCRGRSRTRRSSTDTAPTSATTGTASSPTSPRTGRSCPSSWTALLLPVAARRWRRTSRRSRERTGIAIRYGCRWTGTRREEAATASAFVLETSDGEYRGAVARLRGRRRRAVRARPPGIELAAHYADTRPAETYADKRIFIIGKQNSGFELASGLLQWAAASSWPRRRRRSCRSTRTRSSASGRATSSRSRTTRSGAACPILDAAIEGIEQRRRRVPGPRPTERRRLRARVRGRRGDRGDRVHDAAPRPAGARGGDVRPEPAAGA